VTMVMTVAFRCPMAVGVGTVIAVMIVVTLTSRVLMPVAVAALGTLVPPSHLIHGAPGAGVDDIELGPHQSPSLHSSRPHLEAPDTQGRDVSSHPIQIRPEV